MRSAELQSEEFDFPGQGSEPADVAASTSDLRQQVAERLAAHRSRRGRQTGPALVTEAAPKPVRKKSNSIAAAVAERYAQSQSYRDFLAAEAERAIEQANLAAQEAAATAQVAARSAQAILFAQQELLEELENWNPAPIQQVSRTQFDYPQTEIQTPQPEFQPEPVHQQTQADTNLAAERDDFFARALPEPAFVEEFAPEPVVYREPAYRAPVATRRAVVAPSDLTVRLYEDIGVRQPQAGPLHRSDMPSHPTLNPIDTDETYALDEEIEFRQAPVFEEPSGPPVAIPANLIEFPRQLIAARRARPRTAEGPLRDEAETAASAQLRIFEVEPSLISTAPAAERETNAPVWSSILLDTPPVIHVAVEPEPKIFPPMQVAPLNLRLMAGMVDLCAVSATFLVGLTVFALWANVLPTGITAAATGVATLTVFYALYNLLFFTFSEATPGMRYARIGLCTFEDENPTRSEMRRRTFALIVAALPLGLGFAWAWFDGEGLGWHDRLSRMYQRHY
ncbi:RDD family protein [Granulicella aggregans]|nr:RDD family protein [Granulicella aggregans]